MVHVRNFAKYLEQSKSSIKVKYYYWGFPGGSDGEESVIWDTWAPSLGQEIPWRRAWLPTAVFLPEEFHGQRSPVGYSPWDHKKSDTTEGLTHTSLLCRLSGKQSAWNAGDIRDMGSIPGLEYPLEEDVATHFSVLSWEISKTEEPGGYRPWGRKRLKDDLAIKQ